MSYRIMQESRGIGISAPQVGSDKRFFWANGKLYVNPTITRKDPHKVVLVEGCLSLPGQAFDVERHLAISAEWHDLDGNPQSGNLINTDAIVFQHEYDHLEGIMIDERGTPTERVSS